MFSTLQKFDKSDNQLPVCSYCGSVLNAVSHGIVCNCAEVLYCSSEHQKSDWKNHKPIHRAFLHLQRDALLSHKMAPKTAQRKFCNIDAALLHLTKTLNQSEAADVGYKLCFNEKEETLESCSKKENLMSEDDISKILTTLSTKQLLDTLKKGLDRICNNTEVDDKTMLAKRLAASTKERLNVSALLFYDFLISSGTKLTDKIIAEIKVNYDKTEKFRDSIIHVEEITSAAAAFACAISELVNWTDPDVMIKIAIILDESTQRERNDRFAMRLDEFKANKSPDPTKPVDSKWTRLEQQAKTLEIKKKTKTIEDPNERLLHGYNMLAQAYRDYDQLVRNIKIVGDDSEKENNLRQYNRDLTTLVSILKTKYKEVYKTSMELAKKDDVNAFRQSDGNKPTSKQVLFSINATEIGKPRKYFKRERNKPRSATKNNFDEYVKIETEVQKLIKKIEDIQNTDVDRRARTERLAMLGLRAKDPKDDITDKKSNISVLQRDVNRYRTANTKPKIDWDGVDIENETTRKIMMKLDDMSEKDIEKNFKFKKIKESGKSVKNVVKSGTLKGIVANSDDDEYTPEEATASSSKEVTASSSKEVTVSSSKEATDTSKLVVTSLLAETPNEEKVAMRRALDYYITKALYSAMLESTQHRSMWGSNEMGNDITIPNDDYVNVFIIYRAHVASAVKQAISEAEENVKEKESIIEKYMTNVKCNHTHYWRLYALYHILDEWYRRTIGCVTAKEQIGIFLTDLFNEQTKIFRNRPNRNVYILGVAGTGKTTLANIWTQVMRLIGEFPRSANVSKSLEGGKQNLIGAYVGWTVHRTNEFLAKCIGSIGFLDEGYTIAGSETGLDSYGIEALNAIVTKTSEYAGLLCLITAGYADKMRLFFFSLNQGLLRRFPLRFDMDILKAPELVALFLIRLHEKKFTLKGYSLSTTAPDNNWVRDINETSAFGDLCRFIGAMWYFGLFANRNAEAIEPLVKSCTSVYYANMMTIEEESDQYRNPPIGAKTESGDQSIDQMQKLIEALLQDRENRTRMHFQPIQIPFNNGTGTPSEISSFKTTFCTALQQHPICILAVNLLGKDNHYVVVSINSTTKTLTIYDPLFQPPKEFEYTWNYIHDIEKSILECEELVNAGYGKKEIYYVYTGYQRNDHISVNASGIYAAIFARQLWKNLPKRRPSTKTVFALQLLCKKDQNMTIDKELLNDIDSTKHDIEVAELHIIESKHIIAGFNNWLRANATGLYHFIESNVNATDFSNLPSPPKWLIKMKSLQQLNMQDDSDENETPQSENQPISSSSIPQHTYKSTERGNAIALEIPSVE